MPNFEENVRITWEISQAKQSAEQLQSILLKTAESFENVRKATAEATSGIASSFSPIISSIGALNARLQTTLELMDRVRTSGGGGGGGTVSTGAGMPPTPPGAHLPISTGGAVSDDSYIDNLRRVVVANKQLEDSIASLNTVNRMSGEATMGMRETEATYSLGNRLRAANTQLAEFDQYKRIGQIRGEMMAEIEAYNQGVALQAMAPGRADPTVGIMRRMSGEARTLGQKYDPEEYARGLQNEADAAAKAETGMGLLNNQWVRHLGWITQTILIMGALRVAYGFIEEVTRDILGLSDATARLNFVTGQGAEAARSGLLQESTRAARYGVDPTSAYSGAVIAAQFGAPAETTKTAAQIALLTGQTEDYSNIVQEVAQTVRRGNGEFDNQTRLLDLMATLYRSADLSQEAYFDSMQEAIPISKLLGLSIEETAVIIARITQTTEDTPKAASGFFAKIVQRVSQPEVKAALATQYGIEGDSLKDVIRQSAQMISQLEATGQSGAAEKLAVLLSGGGGASAREDLKRLGISFDIFLETMDEGVETGGAFNEMLGEVGKSGKLAFDQLTSAVKNFINVMANTGPFKVVIETVIGGTRGTAETFNQWAEIATGEDAFMKLSMEERRRKVADFNKQLGYEAISEFAGLFFAHPSDQMRQSAMESLPEWARSGPGMYIGGPIADTAARDALFKALVEFSAGNLEPELYSGSGTGGGTVKRGGGGGFTYTEPRAFGGFRDLPQGTSAAEIQKRADAAEKLIAEATKGTDYLAKKETFFIFDEATKSFQEVTTTSDALSMALKEAADAAKDFAGFMELPKGTTLDDFQKLIDSFEPAIRAAEAGTQDYEQRQRRLVPVGGRYQEVTGSDEAVRRAQQQLQEAGSMFGGFRETPKGMDLDKLEASVKTWTERIVNYEPGTQDYETPRTTAFWDEGKKVWRTITAPMDALKFAIEENTKSQIKGVFNVPAGGEVLVAFQALQAGMMPSDRLGGTATPSSDRLMGAGNRLNEAAAALIAAAARLGVYTQSPGAAFMAVKRFGWTLGGEGIPDVPDEAMNDFVGASLPRRNFGTGGGGGLLRSPIDIHIQRLLDSRGDGGEKQIVLNNTSQLQVDGKILATHLQTQMYKMLSIMRRSLTGGDSNSVMVG